MGPRTNLYNIGGDPLTQFNLIFFYISFTFGYNRCYIMDKHDAYFLYKSILTKNGIRTCTTRTHTTHTHARPLIFTNNPFTRSYSQITPPPSAYPPPAPPPPPFHPILSSKYIVRSLQKVYKIQLQIFCAQYTPINCLPLHHWWFPRYVDCASDSVVVGDMTEIYVHQPAVCLGVYGNECRAVVLIADSQQVHLLTAHSCQQVAPL